MRVTHGADVDRYEPTADRRVRGRDRRIRPRIEERHEGLGNMPDGVRVLPFVRLFHSAPSTRVWEDELGDPQLIPQGEGGEQGDPTL